MESICLVEPSPDSGTLQVNPAALSFLKALAGRLWVVAIFGPKGTGKSFLLDQLVGQDKGSPHSPGIWLHCSPHPTRPDETLLLLDTEGLPEKMEKDEKSISFKLFLLDVLMCNIFIYNTKGAWNAQEELDKLTYMKMLPDKVRVLEDCPLVNRFLLSSMLPNFVWCLRDVASEESVLQDVAGNLDVTISPPAVSASENTTISYIQSLFPSQKVFCFCPPHVDGKEGEAVSSDILHPVFQARLCSLKYYILNQRPKNSPGSRFSNGKDWSATLERFAGLLSLNEPIIVNESFDPQAAAFYQVPPPSSSRAAPRMVQPNNMEEPMCLIENNPGEKLQVNQEALQLLQRINQPVVVVAIVGLSHTGKSYLMNKLAGKDKGGFSLSATAQANTKGIWMWCRPHPQKPDHTLVLLDTEGLGDVEKPSSSHVTKLTELIKVKASGRQNCEEEDEIPDDFVCFFPTFIWAVHDFTLQLELDGRPISGDEYLENALRRRKGSPEKLDVIKKYICEYFPSRKCFVFDRPATRQELVHLEDLPERKLNPNIIEEAHRFRSYIFETAEAKIIPGGHTVTGTFLGHLAATYVDAIHSGPILCIGDAVLALAQVENSAAMHDRVKRYEEMVALKLMLPTETVEELMEVHMECVKEAIQVFLDCALKDEGQEYQKQLKDQIQTKLEEIGSHNEQESLDRCKAMLWELFWDLEEKIRNGSYAVPGGYQHFLEDQRKTVERYHQMPQKGLMASIALQDFLKSKETAAQFILQADQNLTDQKKIKVEEAQAAASEREAELQRQLGEQIQRMAEDNEAQLKAELEEEQRRQQSEGSEIVKTS
ncbi:UNVERIFIED_CONTAM: hypothetical protein K2H54_029920 [Gekko kuhli]